MRPAPTARALAAALLLAPAFAGAQRAAADSAARPLHVGLTLGTTGVGLEVARLVAPRLALRAGTSALGVTTRDRDLEELRLDASLRAVGAYLLADVYPFHRAPLRLTLGAMATRATVAARARPVAGQFTFDGQAYAAGEVGSVRGDFTLPRVLPYVGLGFGRPSGYGFRLLPLADLGVGLGHATVALRAENAPSNPRLAADVAAEARRIQDRLDGWPVVPVARLTLAWRY